MKLLMKLLSPLSCLTFLSLLGSVSTFSVIPTRANAANAVIINNIYEQKAPEWRARGDITSRSTVARRTVLKAKDAAASIDDDRRVVITGVGVVSGCGVEKDEVSDKDNTHDNTHDNQSIHKS